MTTEEIENILIKYLIPFYDIQPDGTVNVNGDVSIDHKNITKLPVRFGKVTGFFDCQGNSLTTLEGCPTEVGGQFVCERNELTTLEGGPKYVKGYYDCSHNKLTTLKNGPEKIGNMFVCEYNEIYDLNGHDTIYEYYAGGIFFGGNPIGSLFVNGIGSDLIDNLKIFKVIKDKEINLKRLKYVMSMHDRPIDLDNIKVHYKIV